MRKKLQRSSQQQFPTTNSNFDRPPSCASLKGCIPEVPFEQRKFSVDSLKPGELIPSKNSRGCSEASLADSVGSNNNHANANEYRSQILLVSDKHEKLDTENTQSDLLQKQAIQLGEKQDNFDPRFNAQLAALTQNEKSMNYEQNEEQFILKMKLKDSLCSSNPSVIASDNQRDDHSRKLKIQMDYQLQIISNLEAENKLLKTKLEAT